MKTNHLKKITTLMFSFLVLLLMSSACSSDNQSATPTTASILGRWALDKESITANGITSPEENYENSSPGCATKDYIEFSNSEAKTGYYRADCTLNIGTGNYVRAGNTITITYASGSPDVLEVMSVSSTVLKLRAKHPDAEPGVEVFVNWSLLKVQ